MYLADSGRACLAEVFQRRRVVNRSRNSPYLASLRLERNVTVLDLCGLWPTRAGASQAISTGRRSAARDWARRIYETYPDVQGLRYPSSMHGGGISVALFERARSAIPDLPQFNRPLTDRGMLAIVMAAAMDIGYKVI